MGSDGLGFGTGEEVVESSELEEELLLWVVQVWSERADMLRGFESMGM